MFKLNTVNATWCNIQICIKYQGLLNLQSLAEIKYQYNRANSIFLHFVLFFCTKLHKTNSFGPLNPQLISNQQSTTSRQ
ncbi:hypothetical protein BpHYR1_031131 [Brachionus plicatilis]|uniref:Uncharacterized protein n=1 Tax=Brachionus plicatilis TaxID=10195 RepID=A0A3M7SJE2_BRAPC|nr:hypothetical protein BpHYR1_031131 [Brachionus plicatilis]